MKYAREKRGLLQAVALGQVLLLAAAGCKSSVNNGANDVVVSQALVGKDGPFTVTAASTIVNAYSALTGTPTTSTVTVNNLADFAAGGDRRWLSGIWCSLSRWLARLLTPLTLRATELSPPSGAQATTSWLGWRALPAEHDHAGLSSEESLLRDRQGAGHPRPAVHHVDRQQRSFHHRACMEWHGGGSGCGARLKHSAAHGKHRCHRQGLPRRCHPHQGSRFHDG